MKKRKNPLYPLLGLVGILFSVTAFAYFVMTWRAINSDDPLAASDSLMNFIDRHGSLLLSIELGLLAVLTVAIMATDRQPPRNSDSQSGEPAANPASPSKRS